MSMVSLSKRNSHIGPVSREEILGLAGDLDEATILSILETGATLAEVEEAVMLLSGEDEFAKTGTFKLAGPIAAVYDILATNPAFALEDDR